MLCNSRTALLQRATRQHPLQYRPTAAREITSRPWTQCSPPPKSLAGPPWYEARRKYCEVPLTGCLVFALTCETAPSACKTTAI